MHVYYSTVFLHVLNSCTGKHLWSDRSRTNAILVHHYHHMLLCWISTVCILYAIYMYIHACMCSIHMIWKN